MSVSKSIFFQKNAELFVLIGLVAICGAVYAQAVGFQFINFDDNYYVYDNAFVLNGLNWSSTKWAFTAFHSANWHPLTWLSHMLDATLFGNNAGAHHATNVVFHIINSFLAFIVFRKMTGSFWKSAIVAALFALHPAHVESVAWVSERKDVLSTLFWLLTMWAYLRYAEEEKRRKGEKENENQSKSEKAKGKNKIADENLPGKKSIFSSSPFLLFSMLFVFALGLMSKPMLVTLPFVLLLCDFWALERLKKLKDLPPLIIEKLPLFILAAVSVYITIVAQRSYGAVQTLLSLPIETRMQNAVVAYAKYIAMLFYPVNLGVAYPYQTTFPAGQFLGSAALLLGITVFCIRQRKARKYLLMGWLWFLGTLVPVIGIMQVGEQSMADRYTYVPYFGLFIMLVWGVWEIFSRLKLNRVAVAAIVSIVLIALSILCFKQVSHWRNPETLYAHTLAAGQGNFIIKHNYCNYLMQHNRETEAEPQCRAAIAENPQFADSYNTLGIINTKLNKLDEAVENFKKSIAKNPNDASVYTNLAAPLAMLGRVDEAGENVEKAAELYKKAGVNPVVLNVVYSNLAAAYASQNKFDKAGEILARILQVSPEKVDMRINYALMLYSQNKLDEAKQQIEQAIKQNPNLAESYNLFGLICVKQNKRDEAAAQFEKALQLKPDYIEAKENLRKIKGETQK